MAGAKNERNGRLEEALATLAQNQATLAQNEAAFVARRAEIDARMTEMKRVDSQRFSRIEALLLEHSLILRALPDAIRDKIGLKPPAP